MNNTLSDTFVSSLETNIDTGPVLPSHSESITNADEYVLATGHRAVHRLMILEEVYGAGTREVLQHCGLRRGMRVGDIGCGAGVVTRRLAALVGPEGSAMGIDASADQLQQARLLAKAHGQKNVIFFKRTLRGREHVCAA